MVSDATNWTNTDYLGADEFTDSNGVKNTVDTSSTDALYYLTDEYYMLSFTDEASGDATNDPDSFTNPGNAFDSDDATFADKAFAGTSEFELGKTFAVKTVQNVRVIASATWNGNGANLKNATITLESYDGAAWSTEATLATDGSLGSGTTSYDGVYALNSSVQGLRIKSNMGSIGGTVTAKLYTLEYSTAYDSSSSVETDTIIDDVIPDSIVVYAKTDIPANTSITVDVSEDGGSTFGLTGKSLNTAIDTSAFTTGDLALKFNLATTDDEVTPKLYGYGVAITDK